jgi:RNA polymerase sigma-70 factor (ECF subfamily)
VRIARPIRPIVASGPLAAFDLCLAETYVRVYRRLRAVAARTVSPQEADDVVQDAMLRALRRRESFRGEAAASTWLHAIVRNAGLDAGRRSRRRPAMPLEEHHIHMPPAQAARASSLADRFSVRVALAKLAPVLRDVCVLYDVFGYTHGEIALRLRIPVGTSKSRLAAGRRRLRRLLMEKPLRTI